MHLFVEKLTNIDFSYLDTARGLVGETWWASAILEGALDDHGMVCDFGIVKKVLRDWLDTEIDHRLLVPTLAKGVKVEHLATHEDNDQEDRICLHFPSDKGLISMTAPAQAITLIEAEQITADIAAQWSIQQLTHHFGDNLEQLKLTFEPEEISTPFYHYSHGLKKHDGNCQRIAHGHRSRVQIWVNDERNTEEEAHWASLWQDIYLGSEEDIVSQQDHRIRFEYQAQQGKFELTLPAEICYLFDTDTTVEWIADHLAKKVQQRHPEKTIRVRAFEGVNKGAQV